MRVLATRAEAEGFLLRRTRECDHGHRYATLEVDDSLTGTVLRFATRRARIQALQARVARWHRNQRVLQMDAAGEKHAVIARETGLSDNMVTHIVRKQR